MQEDKYLEARLVEWADWYKRGIYFGLGYPSKTVEQRLREEGGQIIKGTGQKNEPENPRADEMDILIREMSRRYPEPARVLKSYYFACDTLSAEKIAKRSNMSKTTFYSHLNIAKVWLSAKLTEVDIDYSKKIQKRA
jgi:hypothetical protein